MKRLGQRRHMDDRWRRLRHYGRHRRQHIPLDQPITVSPKPADYDKVEMAFMEQPAPEPAL
jgi:hypothetical protein